MNNQNNNWIDLPHGGAMRTENGIPVEVSDKGASHLDEIQILQNAEEISGIKLTWMYLNRARRWKETSIFSIFRRGAEADWNMAKVLSFACEACGVEKGKRWFGEFDDRNRVWVCDGCWELQKNHPEYFSILQGEIDESLIQGEQASRMVGVCATLQGEINGKPFSARTRSGVDRSGKGLNAIETPTGRVRAPSFEQLPLPLEPMDALLDCIRGADAEIKLFGHVLLTTTPDVTGRLYLGVTAPICPSCSANLLRLRLARPGLEINQPGLPMNKISDDWRDLPHGGAMRLENGVPADLSDKGDWRLDELQILRDAEEISGINLMWLHPSRARRWKETSIFAIFGHRGEVMWRMAKVIVVSK